MKKFIFTEYEAVTQTYEVKLSLKACYKLLRSRQGGFYYYPGSGIELRNRGYSSEYEFIKVLLGGVFHYDKAS